MKKLFLLSISAVVLCGFVYFNNLSGSNDISDKLIRFHVVANSDSETDQNVKLKVRDAILKEIGPKLSKSKSREESLQILKENTGKIEGISNKILKKDGKSYTANAQIGDFNFPIKSYGNITLPEGEYRALKVVLGEGEGKNWWCVMFPPLCFIDITRGLTTEETDEELERVLDEDEMESITAFKQESPKLEVSTKVENKESKVGKAKDSKEVKEVKETSKEVEEIQKNNDEPKIEFKLKSVEVIKNTFTKIKSFFN